jgi:hypothetical protein
VVVRVQVELQAQMELMVLAERMGQTELQVHHH